MGIPHAGALVRSGQASQTNIKCEATKFEHQSLFCKTIVDKGSDKGIVAVATSCPF